jgi:exosortase
MRLEQPFIQSVLCIAAIWLSVVLVAGWRWAWALAPAIAYLILGFPILDRIIDRATLPLQQVSTEVAYQILDVLGYKPFRTDSVTINLDKFTLFVAAACSGLKTTIAISAAVVFFMIISRLQFFANLILATIAIPLSVFINGVRIAMIGMVGNEYGEKAGHDFHDYSGYIALALCFYLLYLITKGLEFKKKS